MSLNVYKSFKYLQSKPPWHNLAFPLIVSLVICEKRLAPTSLQLPFRELEMVIRLDSFTAKAGYWNLLPPWVKLLPVQSASSLFCYIGVFHWGSKILICFWTMLICQHIPSGCWHPLTHQPCPPEVYWSIDSSSSCCIHRICWVLCTNVLIVQLINKDTIFPGINSEGKLLCGWQLDFMLL